MSTLTEDFIGLGIPILNFSSLYLSQSAKAESYEHLTTNNTTHDKTPDGKRAQSARDLLTGFDAGAPQSGQASAQHGLQEQKADQAQSREEEGVAEEGCQARGRKAKYSRKEDYQEGKGPESAQERDEKGDAQEEVEGDLIELG